MDGPSWMMNDVGLCWCGVTNDRAASVVPCVELEMCLKVTEHLQNLCHGLDWSRWCVCVSVCLLVCLSVCACLCMSLACMCYSGSSAVFASDSVCVREWDIGLPLCQHTLSQWPALSCQPGNGCVWHFILLPILCCSRTKNIAMVTAQEANETGQSVGRVEMNGPIRWNCLSLPPVLPILHQRCAQVEGGDTPARLV